MKSLSVMIGLALVGNVVGDDGWDRFRGANGTGVVGGEGVPVTFDERDYAWNTELPGIGHSSPVAWGERLFLTCLDADGAARSAVGISLADGKVLWKTDFKFAEHSLHRFNNYASTTPCVDADRVYLSWETGDRREVVALSHDGREMWKKDVGFYEENHGTGASPILVDGLLIVPNDHAGEGGSILALDPVSGATKWSYRRAPEKTSFATPVVYRPERGAAQLLVAGTPYGVTGLDIKTGKKLWESGEPFDQRTVASPVIIGDVVFVSSGQGGGGKKAFAAKIPATKRSKPVEAEWVETKALPYVPTPVVKDGLIYLWTDSG
ncbi:MAG: PQQ-binding-like beta-propeller repeat protein, partial [Verrucomicrobiales bacterium]|nr:PQQ-binding-like beta-propeller repeat protein [Verrucomicrobiales bacterium]